MKQLFFILTFSFGWLSIQAQNMFEIKQGTVSFKSNAPLENIQAESSLLTGLVSLDQNTFAFSVDVKSFKGFNSALQQEHFYENYMETDLYPRATFSGKLIDKFNPDLQTQKIRAKGSLDIHGVKKERIIDVVITKKGDRYVIQSDFNVQLTEHNIRIPKVVNQKIAENINIKVQGEMVRK